MLMHLCGSLLVDHEVDDTDSFGLVKKKMMANHLEEKMVTDLR
jgi:hypothetical protein